MTTSIRHRRRNICFAFLSAAAVLFGGLFILHHTPSPKQDVVATGFMLDILLTIPLSYYLLVVRPFKVRLSSMLLVFSACCGLGYLLLPSHQRAYITQFKMLSTFVEAGVIFYIIIRIPAIRKSYRAKQLVLPDAATNLRESIQEVVGHHPIIKFLVNEMLMIRYGLFFWVRNTSFAADIKKFSVLKESGYPAFFGVILSVGVIEIAAFHLFLEHYSHTAAIITTLLSIYGMLILVGDYSAMKHNPVLVNETFLVLRNGLRWRTVIQTENISQIEKVSTVPDKSEGSFNGGVMKSNVNIKITFKTPVFINRLYGKTINTNEIYMNIGEPDNFIKAINDKVKPSS